MLSYFALVTVLASFVPGLCGAPSVQSLGSDVTILFDNDLLGPASPHADSGAILLSSVHSFEAAESACEALGETLWNPLSSLAKEIQHSFEYLTFSGKFKPGQQFWVASEGSSQRAISTSGAFSTGGSVLRLSLPALCTQSAPFSNESFQDTSSRWQVSLTSNNQVLTGFRDRVSFRFLGIRYASQPARFTHSTIFQGNGKAADATAYGSECVQSTSQGSEDCLFLNIFTPFLPTSSNPSASDLKPVMFHIHGGAFTSGTGNDPTFDGGSLASRGDVVLVDINYRLTTLGFLALNDGVTKGNFGFADQVVALDWVRANIHNFGGDADRITMLGQSAGAASIRAHLASPQSIGKFAAAIPMSNLAGSNYATTYSLYYTIPEEVTVAAEPILAATNCTNATSQLECLRQVPAFTLANMANVARFLVVDGTYLISDELQLSGKGPVANVHLMMGFMRDDGAAFIGFPTTTDVTTALNDDGFNASTVVPSGEFPQPAGSNTTLDVFNVTARVATDGEFRCLDQATAFAGAQNHLFKDIHFYEFNRSYQTPGFDPNAPACDAPITASRPFGDPDAEYFKCHSGELYFAFGNLLRMGLPLRDDNDLPFMQFTMDTWASFARTYDPNPDQGFLTARGFTNTSLELKTAGSWEPVTTSSFTLRELQWPSFQQGFREDTQCNVLGFPLSYYLNH